MRASRVVAVFLGLLVAVGPSPASAGSSPGPFDFHLIATGRGLTLHKELYFLPYSHSDTYNGAESEVFFQLSAKHDLFGTRFYFAYTQISFWQAYNTKDSSPFRETNYNPELFYRFGESTVGPGWLGADLGFEHESNGQRVPLSRSWNLLYAAPFFHGDDWLACVKLRYRLPEDDKPTPDSPEGDDNADITDYLGYSDIHLYYTLPWGHLAHFLVRGYIGADLGNISLNYSFPLPGNQDAYFVVRLFNGAGESMIDYNRHISRVGVGLMFNR